MKKLRLLSLSLLAVFLYGCTIPDPASIGIIGGADGPTAVLVTGSFMPVGLILAAVIVAVVVAILVIRHKKHK